MPGMARPAQETAPKPTTPMSLPAYQVTIQHTDTVNIYTTDEPDPQPETTPAPATPTEIRAYQVTIQQADTVNIYNIGGPDPEQEVTQNGGCTNSVR